MSDDLRFDQVLTEDAAALPPSGVEVNPWREAMCLVLWGLGLTTLTLHFLYLDVILPAIGAILMVLGFRTLRRENRALQWCYRLSIAAAAVRSIAYTLNALPWETGYVPAYVVMLLTLALYICLWRGMVGVSRAAGSEKPAAPAAGALVIFYAVMIPLAYIGLEGWLAVLPLVIIYIVILRNLVKLSRSLADTGYVVTAAPVRLPSRAVLWGYLGVTLAAILLAMFLGQRYPMDWQPRADVPQDAAIRAELLELGFPRDVLDDLTADEVAQMAGAANVYTETDVRYDQETYREEIRDEWYDTIPANWEYDHADRQADGSYRYAYRVYEQKVCTMTHAAVQIPAEDGMDHWLFVHHLQYHTPQRYTESMELYPVWQDTDFWSRGELCSGRVLCRQQGQESAAAFFSLQTGRMTTNSFFGFYQQDTVTAQWSLPCRSTDVRVYVMYDAYEKQQVTFLNSWANYAGQTGPTYPFADALTLSHSWQTGNICRWQTALQKELSEAEETE